MKLDKPKNDWAKALWILNENFIGGCNMTKVLTKYEPTFWKFQTRLGEVIEQYPKLRVKKTAVPFQSKITGKSGYTTFYTPLCTPTYLKTVYDLVNKFGLKGEQKIVKA